MNLVWGGPCKASQEAQVWCHGKREILTGFSAGKQRDLKQCWRETSKAVLGGPKWMGAWNQQFRCEGLTGLKWPPIVETEEKKGLRKSRHDFENAESKDLHDSVSKPRRTLGSAIGGSEVWLGSCWTWGTVNTSKWKCPQSLQCGPRTHFHSQSYTSILYLNSKPVTY